jgi:hypothetical protein
MSLDSDPASFVETALNDVCFGDDEAHPLDATIDRYFTPDYQQRTDGELLDRDGATSRMEIYLFGELADDGRLRRVDEISRLLDGDDHDTRLARAR